jgi:LacI family transcriptional regulator
MKNLPQSKRQTPTIFDVAQKAGVTISTVSLVLRKAPKGYSEKTATKVLAAAKAVGYRPNIAAQNLAQKRTNIVAVWGWLNRQALFHFDMLLGIQERLSKTDLAIYLVKWSNDPKENEKTFEDLMYRHFVCGIILTSRALDDASMKFLKESNVPTVVTETSSPYADSVGIDNWKGGYLAGKHLVERGCKNIAIITGWKGEPNRQRRLGCEKALKEAGLRLKAEYFFDSPNELYEEGYKAAKKSLDLKPLVDGLFCAAGDIAASGAIGYFKEKGLDVPRDVHVVGYDNILESAHFDPPLTTIHQPAFEVGLKAADCLVGTLDGRRKGIEQVVYEPKLVVRKSS